ncbi:hypothetical protein GCM10023144_27920 [Pigmentiphaga soli]|uniref:Uncharacterized protein n=1 Tax=Pigmentiphaga soli TaxID=1007095 RepID=A0ABP8H6A7_9BURK
MVKVWAANSESHSKMDLQEKLTSTGDREGWGEDPCDPGARMQRSCSTAGMGHGTCACRGLHDRKGRNPYVLTTVHKSRGLSNYSPLEGQQGAADGIFRIGRRMSIDAGEGETTSHPGLQ